MRTPVGISISTSRTKTVETTRHMTSRPMNTGATRACERHERREAVASCEQPPSVQGSRRAELTTARGVRRVVVFDKASPPYGESHHRHWSTIREVCDDSGCSVHEHDSCGLSKPREGKGSLGHGTRPS